VKKFETFIKLNNIKKLKISNILLTIMSQIVQEQSSIPIYRYKFSEPFMNKLVNFANNHRYDDAGVFKERWDRWTANDQNISEIIREDGR
jgi:hypothetical protein